MFCEKCGSRLAERVKFCSICGTPTGFAPKQTAQPSVQKPLQPDVSTLPVSPPQQHVLPVQKNVQPPAAINPETGMQKFRSIAASVSGETALGNPVSAVSGAISRTLPGPAQVIANSSRSFIQSLGGIMKRPVLMIPALLLAVCWFVLNILQAKGHTPMPAKIMSFLTFAQGGMQGGMIGAVGGIFGKGITAGALTSLLTKHAERKLPFADRLKSAFGISRNSAGPYAVGAGTAMLLYLFMSGGAARLSFMGGIAAAFLAARSAVHNGFLKRLCSSFTKKGRAGDSPGASGFVRGLAAGFLSGEAFDPDVYLDYLEAKVKDVYAL